MDAPHAGERTHAGRHGLAGSDVCYASGRTDERVMLLQARLDFFDAQAEERPEAARAGQPIVQRNLIADMHWLRGLALDAEVHQS
ncbi:MAG: hypothetical protein Kow0022_10990 [Phycisphaerales bacterium]